MLRSSIHFNLHNCFALPVYGRGYIVPLLLGFASVLIQDTEDCRKEKVAKKNRPSSRAEASVS